MNRQRYELYSLPSSVEIRFYEPVDLAPGQVGGWRDWIRAYQRLRPVAEHLLETDCAGCDRELLPFDNAVHFPKGQRQPEVSLTALLWLNGHRDVGDLLQEVDRTLHRHGLEKV